MSYKVTIYGMTGLNGVDVMSKKNILSSYKRYEYTAFDIISQYFLESINVPRPASDLWDCDLISIEWIDEGTAQTHTTLGFIYEITGVTPLDPATSRLSLVPDYWSSFIYNMPINFTAEDINTYGYLKVTGGITTRYSYPPDFGTWGLYGDNDPLLAPQRPLKLVIHNFMNKGGLTASASNTVIESLIDLTELAEESQNGNLVGKVFKATDGTTTIQPYTPPVKNHTNYYLDMDSSVQGYDGFQSDRGPLISPGTKLYGYNYSNIQEALGIVQTLDVKSSLISCVQYPSDYITVVTNTSETSSSRGEVTSINGKVQEWDTGIVKNYIPEDNRNRFSMIISSSDYRKFGLITARGDRSEFIPSQVQNPDKLICLADPRPNGAPYFRFLDYMGQQATLETFFNGAVKGMEWAQVPLVWSQPAGSYLNTMNFDAARKRATNDYEYNQRTGLRNIITGGLNSAVGLAGAIAKGDAAGVVSSAIGGVSDFVSQAESMEHAREQFEIEKNNQLANFGFSQQVYVPDVMFPFNADTLRDFCGNGVIVYEYQYDDADISRISTLLSMYGVKCSLPCTGEMLLHETLPDNNDFQYVEVQGLQLTSSIIPKWWLNGMQMQLANGVRMWTTRPNAQDYAS